MSTMQNFKLRRTTILAPVLYGRETLRTKLRENIEEGYFKNGPEENI
jgi:hypothetical protein